MSEYIAKASIEPRDYRVVFLIQERADNHKDKYLMCYRLCVFASGSLITDILNCLRFITASCLHFGQ